MIEKLQSEINGSGTLAGSMSTAEDLTAEISPSSILTGELTDNNPLIDVPITDPKPLNGVLTIPIGTAGGSGRDGKSAYEIAVDNGFAGTVSE